MKIKKSIKQQHDWGLEKCRWALTSAIIEMCKESGIDSSIDIQFTQMVMIHTTKTVNRRGHFSHFETETILADRISWNENHKFFMIGIADHYCKSSDFLTIDALCIIYEEMRNVLRKL